MEFRRIIATIGALSIATIAMASTSASAAASHTTTKKEYFSISGTGEHQIVIAHGAFVGGGKDDASHDAYDVLHLGGGTLRVNHPESKSHFTEHVNPTTCYGTFTITGKYTLSHGTGKYKGITGHGKYKAVDEAILARTKSGACDDSKEPPVEITKIKASGPVKI